MVWEGASPDLPLHTRGGRLGLSAELLKEGFPEPLVLPQSLTSPSREGIKAHQAQVRLLVGSILGHHPPQRFDGLSKLPTILQECTQLQE